MEIQPLANLAVLDLTEGVAGPYCTKLLADYGALVVKVEDPRGGDASRAWGPFPNDIPHRERSGAFLHLNTGKLGVTLDLKSSQGRRMLIDLVREVDGVVESARPGTMEAKGLSYRTLASVNPDLVMASITPFGQSGPYRDYASAEIVLQAIAGPAMHTNGTAAREPLKSPHYDAQYFAGLYAAVAVAGALFEKKLKGQGRYLDISMAEAWLAHPIDKGSLFPYTGQRATRPPESSRWNYLMGGYPCKDGFVAVQGSGRGETWWPRVFQMMAMPHLSDDPRFNTPEGRAAHRDELDGLWYGWLAEHTRSEVFAAARKARFPVAPVYEAKGALQDPHFRARGFFVEVQRAEVGRLVQPGAPFKLAPPGPRLRPAPLLGEHNAHVYSGWLGYSRQEMAALRELAVI